MKKISKTGIITIASLTIVVLLSAVVGNMFLASPQRNGHPDRIPVLAYHSIMPHEFYYPRNVDNPWILLDETFYEQMAYLYKNDFTPLTATQLIDFLFYDGDLPDNPIVITFDDGYLDNYLFAAPILQEFGFTAIVFLITDSIQEATPIMTAYPTQFMSLTEIFASSDVFEYGSHSHAMHNMVDGVPLMVSESVADIRADIRQSFDVSVDFTSTFAYPFGRHSSNAITALQEEGVRIAFATHWGYVYRDTDPLLLPRLSVTSDWTPEQFSSIVGGRWGRWAR